MITVAVHFLYKGRLSITSCSILTGESGDDDVSDDADDDDDVRSSNDARSKRTDSPVDDDDDTYTDKGSVKNGVKAAAPRPAISVGTTKSTPMPVYNVTNCCYFSHSFNC